MKQVNQHETPIEEEAIHRACAYFDRKGNAFDRTLAHLWRLADQPNKKILASAFADKFRQGYEQALKCSTSRGKL